MVAVLNQSSTPTPQTLAVASATRYMEYGDATLIHTPAETNQFQIVKSPGIISKLTVRITANTTGTAVVFIVRKNLGVGLGTVSVPAGTTGEFQDSTNTDNVGSGDLITYRVINSSSGSFTQSLLASVFTATANTVKRYTTSSNSSTTPSATWFFKFVGLFINNAVEAQEQVRFLTAGTLQNGYINVVTNSRPDTTTYQVRKNGSNGNVTISIPASSSGNFEDAVNTDSFAVGDLGNWVMTTGPGAGTILAYQGIEFSTTDSSTMYVAGGPLAGTVQNVSTVTYGSVQSRSTAAAVESDVQAMNGVAAVVSNLSINVTANTVIADSNLRFRKNGADGNQNVTIPGLGTGIFTDGVNTDSITASDVINTALTTGAGGTSLLYRYTAMKLAPPGGGGGGSGSNRMMMGIGM